MYYKVYTWLVTQLVVSIHPSMGRHFTLTGTINTSAECPEGTLSQTFCTSSNCPGESLHSDTVKEEEIVALKKQLEE